MIQEVVYSNLTREWYRSMGPTLVDEASATNKRVKNYELTIRKLPNSYNYVYDATARRLGIPEDKWDRPKPTTIWSTVYGVLSFTSLFAYIFSEELSKVYSEQGWFSTCEQGDFAGKIKFALKGVELSDEEVSDICKSTINRIHEQAHLDYVVDTLVSKFSRPRSTVKKLTASDKGIVVYDKYKVRIEVGDVIAIPTGSGATAHGTAFGVVESYSEKTVKTNNGSNYAFDRVFVIASPLNPTKRMGYSDLLDKSFEDNFPSVYF